MFLPMSHMAQEMQKNHVGMTMIRVQDAIDFAARPLLVDGPMGEHVPGVGRDDHHPERGPAAALVEEVHDDVGVRLGTVEADVVAHDGVDGHENEHGKARDVPVVPRMTKEIRERDVTSVRCKNNHYCIA